MLKKLNKSLLYLYLMTSGSSFYDKNINIQCEVNKTPAPIGAGVDNDISVSNQLIRKYFVLPLYVAFTVARPAATGLTSNCTGALRSAVVALMTELSRRGAYA